MFETTISIIISVLSLSLTLLKYLDRSKEKMNKVCTDIELLKLQVEQASKYADHVEKTLQNRMEDQKEVYERLSEKLDEIKDKLNE